MKITYNYSKSHPGAVNSLRLESENQAEFFQLVEIESLCKEQGVDCDFLKSSENSRVLSFELRFR